MVLPIKAILILVPAIKLSASCARSVPHSNRTHRLSRMTAPSATWSIRARTVTRTSQTQLFPRPAPTRSPSSKGFSSLTRITASLLRRHCNIGCFKRSGSHILRNHALFKLINLYTTRTSSTMRHSKPRNSLYEIIRKCCSVSSVKFARNAFFCFKNQTDRKIIAYEN